MFSFLKNHSFLHPPSEVKGPCRAQGWQMFPTCAGISFHLIFIAALLNSVSKYKVTVPPRNWASSLFLNFNYMVFNTSLGCAMSSLRGAFIQMKFMFFHLLSSTFRPVTVKAVGTQCSLEFQYEKWRILAFPMALRWLRNALTDWMFSQFLHEFHLPLKELHSNFRCADIEQSQYASKGLKYLVRAVWMPCPHHTELVHDSTILRLYQGVSGAQERQFLGGKSGKCLPLPLCFGKGMQGWRLLTLYLHK